MRLTCSGSLTSARSGSTFAPSFPHSCATSSSDSFFSRAISTRSAPSRANASAIALPLLRPAPPTSATLPFRSPIAFLSKERSFPQHMLLRVGAVAAAQDEAELRALLHGDLQGIADIGELLDQLAVRAAGVEGLDQRGDRLEARPRVVPGQRVAAQIVRVAERGNRAHAAVAREPVEPAAVACDHLALRERAGDAHPPIEVGNDGPGEDARRQAPRAPGRAQAGGALQELPRPLFLVPGTHEGKEGEEAHHA